MNEKRFAILATLPSVRRGLRLLCFYNKRDYRIECESSVSENSLLKSLVSQAARRREEGNRGLEFSIICRALVLPTLTSSARPCKLCISHGIFVDSNEDS